MDKASGIIIYQNHQGGVQLDVRLEDESVWLNQAQIAQLFGKGRSTVSEHIGHIFQDGELDETVVCRDFRQTTLHGAIKGKTQEKQVKFYNLDVIISVGYRVKSQQGTQFRIWATQQFFKIVQNKLFWAISQQTAAELVYRRADASLPLMKRLEAR